MRKYRSNVAALLQCDGKFVACLRTKFPGWQCVQGGIDDEDLSAEHALLREFTEELGIPKSEVKILERSAYWRRYDFISNPIPYHGQEQLWFFAKIESMDVIDLSRACDEFSEVKLMTIGELVENYVAWKKHPFVDFCRELNLF